MPPVSKKEIRYILISILVVSAAFTVKEISPIFYLQVFLLVALSYGVHIIVYRSVSEGAGIGTTLQLWPLGLLIAIISGIISGGLAVISVPAVFRKTDVEERRWMKKAEGISGREYGVIAISGVVANLVLACLMLYLSTMFGLSILGFGALINFWIAISNLIPVPSFDGAKVVTWSGWMWALAVLISAIGIAGYFLHP